jgi:hypothetical protein
MTTFRNPANGYEEDVTLGSFVGALLFGLLWFMVNGLWSHALIQFVLVIICIAFPPLTMVMFFVWIGYAIVAKELLSNKYRKMGLVAATRG